MPAFTAQKIPPKKKIILLKVVKSFRVYVPAPLRFGYLSACREISAHLREILISSGDFTWKFRGIKPKKHFVRRPPYISVNIGS